MKDYNQTWLQSSIRKLSLYSYIIELIIIKSFIIFCSFDLLPPSWLHTPWKCFCARHTGWKRWISLHIQRGWKKWINEPWDETEARKKNSKCMINVKVSMQKSGIRQWLLFLHGSFPLTLEQYLRLFRTERKVHLIKHMKTHNLIPCRWQFLQNCHKSERLNST